MHELRRPARRKAAGSPPHRAAAFAVIIVACAFSGSAHAFTPTGNAIADELFRGLEAEGSTVTAASVTGDTDTADIGGLEITSTEGDVTSRIRIERLLLDEARLVDGRIEARSVEAANIAISNPDGGITARRLGASSLVVDSGRAAITTGETGEITIEGMELAIGDLSLPLGTLTVSASDVVEGIAANSALTWTGLSIARDQVAPGPLHALFAALGYDRLTLALTGSARWNPDAGTLDLGPITLAGDDVGLLTITLRFGNATRALVQRMQAETDPEKANGVLLGLTVIGGTVTFENRSIVDRLLAMQAENAGITPDVFAAQLAASLPLLLNGLGDPPLQTELANAGGAFLTNPGSLTVNLAPPTPVALGAVVGTIPTAPQTLPALLGASVAATPKTVQ